MSEDPSLLAKLAKYLPWVEMFLLLVLAIGIAFKFFGVDPNGLVRTSLGGLAVVFFLYAYEPQKLHEQENGKSGFNALLSFSILPKVIWLSSSISLIGILFYYLHLGNEGYKNILVIGSTSIGTALIFQGVLFYNGTKNTNAMLPQLYRAIPILLIDIFILTL